MCIYYNRMYPLVENYKHYLLREFQGRWGRHWVGEGHPQSPPLSQHVLQTVGGFHQLLCIITYHCRDIFFRTNSRIDDVDKYALTICHYRKELGNDLLVFQNNVTLKSIVQWNGTSELNGAQHSLHCGEVVSSFRHGKQWPVLC